MATYTPNYNLEKPDATDDFKNFRQSYNDNMDKIDQIGGGGSGGHTIIDENGTSMAQRTGLQFVGASVTDDAVNDKTIVTITGGGGGGGGGITTLYSSNTPSLPATINLSQSFRNFDLLLITGSSGGADGWNISGLFKCSDLADGVRVTITDESHYVGYYITDNTTLSLSGGSYYGIVGIFGINTGGGSGVTTQLLYTGKESQYFSDNSDTPMEFDVRTEGTDFATYLSTSDHKTFTALQNFACLVTYGIEQDPNLSSSNSPNCSFYVNGAKVLRVVTPSSASGSNAISAAQVILFAGDTFFWGSDDSRGYAVRLGQIDLLDGIDLSSYVKPSF